MASNQEIVPPPNPTPTYHDNVDNIEKQQPTEHDEVARMSGKMLNEDARLATQAEHNLGLWQAIKTYRKAVFWSVTVSSSIIMEGYDTTLVCANFALTISFLREPSFWKISHKYMLLLALSQSFKTVERLGSEEFKSMDQSKWTQNVFFVDYPYFHIRV
jgi:hypothetical protein